MRKRRRTRRDWPAVLQAQVDSGLSVTAFCRQEGISPSLVYRWRRRLHIEPEAPAQERFVELHPAPVGASGSGVAVVADSGWRLELEPGFDEATLQRALACVAHQAPCSP